VIIICIYILSKYTNTDSKKTVSEGNIDKSSESVLIYDSESFPMEKLEEYYLLLGEHNKTSDFEMSVYGNISLKKFYGPPNYGETPETDEIEAYYVLTLIEPIILENVLKLNVGEEIQLILNSNVNEKFNANSNYNIKGNGFLALTGHHHTPIILISDEILLYE
jgi:hypothetical protein